MEENTAQEEIQLPPIDFIAFITDLITHCTSLPAWI